MRIQELTYYPSPQIFIVIYYSGVIATELGNRVVKEYRSCREKNASRLYLKENYSS
jgi:hypothetical protein